MTFLRLLSKSEQLLVYFYTSKGRNLSLVLIRKRIAVQGEYLVRTF